MLGERWAPQPPALCPRKGLPQRDCGHSLFHWRKTFQWKEISTCYTPQKCRIKGFLTLKQLIQDYELENQGYTIICLCYKAFNDITHRCESTEVMRLINCVDNTDDTKPKCFSPVTFLYLFVVIHFTEVAKWFLWKVLNKSQFLIGMSWAVGG